MSKEESPGSIVSSPHAEVIREAMRSFSKRYPTFFTEWANAVRHRDVELLSVEHQAVVTAAIDNAVLDKAIDKRAALKALLEAAFREKQATINKDVSDGAGAPSSNETEANHPPPKGFMIDALMPPADAEEALYNILGRYEHWVEKYGQRKARFISFTQSAGAVLTFWADWAMKRLKLLQHIRRS
jgi:hypothetical protein